MVCNFDSYIDLFFNMGSRAHWIHPLICAIKNQLDAVEKQLA